MENKIEVQIVLDTKGVKCVRIVGPSELHTEGSVMYLKIVDLIKNLDETIQRRLKEEYKVAKTNGH
jgi:hypothetical protein